LGVLGGERKRLTCGAVGEKQGLLDGRCLALLEWFLDIQKLVGLYLALREVGVELIKVDCRQDSRGRGQKGRCVSPAHVENKN